MGSGGEEFPVSDDSNVGWDDSTYLLDECAMAGSAVGIWHLRLNLGQFQSLVEMSG